jgi:hypothetical protein
VEVIVISGELLHEVDGEYAEDDEENDAHGVVEVVDTIYVLLHQDTRLL